ncbi:MAG: 3-isopropylmalate dehydrogenase [Candidatus Tectomicrobia bacterium]|uniref:3-isopropylmalate dehydrogenase n=1 Tax=Tectimicrobiota bacterium TaxID=2528274 RepID=A0A932M061_UNCTE|nr:3-isopropylmalate dehydrogenase [Candidatus Tectomicrobia bacterium]
MARIAVIPGDGIGVDVTREAIKVLETLRELMGTPLELVEFDLGAERTLRTGVSLPPGTFEDFRQNYDGIFLGALGDPRIPDMSHAREILLEMRFQLDLYINHRPVRLLDESLCPLKGKGVSDVNFVVFRENTEGLYVGIGGIFKKGTPDEVALQEEVNTRKGVERIIRHSFEYARAHGLGKVTMADKSNALRYGHDLWQRAFQEVAAEYPEVEAEHLFIDALTMQMIRKPEQFQVIVTNNMFGDIITDLGAALQGGLGMAASGNINPNGVSMFEPVHGSAPKYAGQNVANPIGAVLTAQMMLQHLGFPREAAVVEEAVVEAIRRRQVTRDLGGPLGTREVGDFIRREIGELAKTMTHGNSLGRATGTRPS